MTSDIYDLAKGGALVRAVIHPGEDEKPHGRKARLDRGSPRVTWGIFFRRPDRTWMEHQSTYYSERAVNKAMRDILSRKHLVLSEWRNATVPMRDIEREIDGNPMNMPVIDLPGAAQTPH